MRPAESFSRPPSRPARTAMISASIETAVSAGVCAPMSSPAGPLIRSRSAPSTPASSRRSRRRSWFRRDLCERLVGPRDDDLVGVGEALSRGETRAGVGHDRAPADRTGGGAERVGRVDRPVDEEARRRSEHVREHAPSLQLGDLAVAGADQLVGDVVFPFEHEPLASVLEVDEEDRPPVFAGDVGDTAEEVRIGLVDPDVDLAAAGQADAEREVVRDPIREQAGCAARQHLAGRLDDLALDAATGHRAGELAGLRDDQLRADRARCRATGRDDAGQRDPSPLRAPAIKLSQDLPHGKIVALGLMAAAAASLAMPLGGRGGFASASDYSPVAKAQWQRQIVSPSELRSILSPQRPQSGGAIRARTSSARISEAQRTMYGTKTCPLIAPISARRACGFSGCRIARMPPWAG